MVIPTHPESERAVLGICLNYADSIGDVLASSQNPSGLFHDERHREVWNRIEKLNRENKPNDGVLIFKERIEYDLEFQFLTDLLNHMIPAQNLWGYLRIALEYQKRRAIINAALQLASDAERTDRPIDASIATAESALYEVQPEQSDDGGLKSATLRVIDGWQYAHQHKDQITGIPSGLVDLDKMLWGFQPKNLIVIGARPSQGKTALLGGIAAHCGVSEKIPTLVFSLESSREELVRRMVCGRGRLNGRELRSGNFTERDMKTIADQTAIMNKSPLFIVDNGSLTIGQMRSVARKFAKRHGIKLILVDYLQKVKPSAKSEKRTYEVAQVSEGLKEMGKELDVPIIAACQLNRESDKDKGRRPRPSDLGDSGMIERDADIIGCLYRIPDQEPGGAVQFELLISKNRDGECGMIPLTYIPQFTKFESASKFSNDDVPTNHND